MYIPQKPGRNRKRENVEGPTIRRLHRRSDLPSTPLPGGERSAAKRPGEGRLWSIRGTVIPGRGSLNHGLEAHAITGREGLSAERTGERRLEPIRGTAIPGRGSNESRAGSPCHHKRAGFVPGVSPPALVVFSSVLCRPWGRGPAGSRQGAEHCVAYDSSFFCCVSFHISGTCMHLTSSG